MLTLKLLQPFGVRTIPIRVTQYIYYSSDDNKNQPPLDEGKIKKKTAKHSVNKEKSNNKNETTSERLNKLLASMQKDEGLERIRNIHVTTATKGKGKQFRKEQKLNEKSNQTDSDDDDNDGEKKKRPKDLYEAAKNVADIIGQDKKKTESELLSKLLGHIDRTGATITSKTDGTQDPSSDSKEFNLRDVIVGMKIDHTNGKQQLPNRGQHVRKTIEDRRRSMKLEEGDDQNQKKPLKKLKRKSQGFMEKSPHPSSGSVNLYGDTAALGIFKNKDDLIPSPDILKTWEYLQRRDLKLCITHPPANYFQKMAIWTEQGKLWKFPIDNEQGLNDESKIDFTEHVFIEQHLEGWCPNKGPIRHFMELVCVGLSKNPYVTAQEKKEHILWYRDYFEKKKDILKDLIVQKDEENTKDKRIE